MKNNLEEAIHKALYAHLGQKRYNGEPYILHPLRIMLKMKTKEERIVAVLHDVLEDSDYMTIAEVYNLYGYEIGDALELLTHNKKDSYEDYLNKIKGNKLALKIKIADIGIKNYKSRKYENLVYKKCLIFAKKIS